MVIDNIKLGFKDLKKNIRNFILFGLLISSISIVIISSSFSLIEIFKEGNRTKITYYAVPVSYEMTDFVKVEDRVDKVLNNGGYTSFVSSNINEEYGVFIKFFLGKFQKNSENKILIGVDMVELESFKQKVKNLKVVSIEDLDKKSLKLVNVDIEFNDENLVFVEMDKKYNSLSDFKLNTDELKNLIENTTFDDKDIENGLDKEFDNAILNSNIVFKKHINSENTETEIDFIIKYIYFFVSLLMLAFSISFGIFIKNLYKKLFREYKIHIICGATKKSIFIRNSVFILTLIFTNFMLMNFLNRFEYNTLFFINIGINIVCILILEFVILNMLIRENLSTTLMGGE